MSAPRVKRRVWSRWCPSPPDWKAYNISSRLPPLGERRALCQQSADALQPSVCLLYAPSVCHRGHCPAGTISRPPLHHCLGFHWARQMTWAGSANVTYHMELKKKSNYRLLCHTDILMIWENSLLENHSVVILALGSSLQTIRPSTKHAGHPGRRAYVLHLTEMWCSCKVVRGAVEEQVSLGDRWQRPQKCEACAGSAHSL